MLVAHTADFRLPPADAPLGAGNRLTIAAGISAALHVGLVWGLTSGFESHLYGDLDPIARAGPPIHARLMATGKTEGTTDDVPIREGTDGPVSNVPSAAVAADSRATVSNEPSHPGRHTLPETGYFAEKDVDVRATPLHDIDPENPDHTGTQRGYVLLSLRISTQGVVERILVVRAQPDFSFGPSAFAAFRNARFSPALRAGIPVPSEKLVELRYAPPETGPSR